MSIRYTKRFRKQYRKLAKKDQRRTDNVIALFIKNPFDPQIKNHALTGQLKGKRAISAGFDLRIVFKIEGDYTIVLMLSVGPHEKVYK